MAFDYIRQVEIEGHNGTIPVGHYNISTFRSSAKKNKHIIKITDNNSSKLTGAVTIECYDSTSGSCCNVTIPVNGLQPDGKYYIDNRLSSATPSHVYAEVRDTTNLYVQLEFGKAVWTKILTQSVSNVEIVEAEAVTGLPELQLQQKYMTLIENIDYGASLPAAGNKGRIFFVKV